MKQALGGVADSGEMRTKLARRMRQFELLVRFFHANRGAQFRPEDDDWGDVNDGGRSLESVRLFIAQAKAVHREPHRRSRDMEWQFGRSQERDFIKDVLVFKRSVQFGAAVRDVARVRVNKNGLGRTAMIVVVQKCFDRFQEQNQPFPVGHHDAFGNLAGFSVDGEPR